MTDSQNDRAFLEQGFNTSSHSEGRAGDYDAGERSRHQYHPYLAALIPTMGAMASRQNSMCKRFFNLIPQLNTEGIDFFTPELRTTEKE